MKLIPKCQEGAEEIQEQQSPLKVIGYNYANDSTTRNKYRKHYELANKGYRDGFNHVLDSINGKSTYLTPNTTANEYKKIMKEHYGINFPYGAGYAYGVNDAMEKYDVDAIVTPNVRRYQQGEDQ